MATSRPSFRVMRNGYDRFAVDAAIDDYSEKIVELTRQLEMYQNRNDELNNQLSALKDKYQSVMSGLMARERVADDISRIALKEANQIIESAQNNADIIIQEALTKAQLIISDAIKLSKETELQKQVIKEQLDNLIANVEQLKIPMNAMKEDLENIQTVELPDSSWIDKELSDD